MLLTIKPATTIDSTITPVLYTVAKLLKIQNKVTIANVAKILGVKAAKILEIFTHENNMKFLTFDKTTGAITGINWEIRCNRAEDLESPKMFCVFSAKYPGSITIMKGKCQETDEMKTYNTDGYDGPYNGICIPNTNEARAKLQELGFVDYDAIARYGVMTFWVDLDCKTVKPTL